MSAPDERTALDLAAAECAREPIRTPGSIQPHGVLLAVQPGDLRLVVDSAGAAELLGVPLELGEPLTGALPRVAEVVRSVAHGEELTGVPVTVELPGGAEHDVVVHSTGGLLVAELEPATGDEDRSGAPRQRGRLLATMRRLQEATSQAQLTDALATSVAELTGFDRVMVYRFDEEWNGEVVAEEARGDLEPFLGLHYPASDIPAQARALYEQQWLRIIVSSDYEPVPLLGAAGDAPASGLDLSGSVLRSVSPVHLQYLRNMGVASSMSISLLLHGRLWGLIACHHYAGPHRPSQQVRSVVEFLGRTASLLLPTVIGLDSYADRLASEQARSRLSEHLAEHPAQAVDAITREATTIADLVPCGGAAVRLNGELRLVGSTPAEDDVVELLGLLAGRSLVTSSLSEQVPALADLTPLASGVLLAPVESGSPGDAVAWFRPEVLREVTWGGDPRSSKVVVEQAGELRLSPRASFDAWSETVRGTAARWADHEVASATAFARHLSDTVLREVERTNRLARALQQTLLLEKLPEVPGLELAARYSPHSDDVVGGDWYDVILLPSGARAAVLGDVAGHGLAVSAISAQMRNALRAYLLSTEDPGQALSRLNDLVVSLMPGDLATAVVLVYDPVSGRAVAASAGHPPLVHVGGHAARTVEGARGPALGLVDGLEYESTPLNVDVGDTLLLYSDGLVETRTESIDERVALLLRTVDETPEDLESLCDRLLSRLSARSDDTTLLALRRV